MQICTFIRQLLLFEPNLKTQKNTTTSYIATNRLIIDRDTHGAMQSQNLDFCINAACK